MPKQKFCSRVNPPRKVFFPVWVERTESKRDGCYKKSGEMQVSYFVTIVLQHLVGKYVVH